MNQRSSAYLRTPSRAGNCLYL